MKSDTLCFVDNWEYFRANVGREDDHDDAHTYISSGFGLHGKRGDGVVGDLSVNGDLSGYAGLDSLKLDRPSAAPSMVIPPQNGEPN
ncbi:MAG: hypothetical protein JXR35_04815 [Rhodobacteraceae bacterium]|nr:hypothetical protein [Paracoccaceae bacterium]